MAAPARRYLFYLDLDLMYLPSYPVCLLFGGHVSEVVATHQVMVRWIEDDA